jgi:hypothetical protein
MIEGKKEYCEESRMILIQVALCSYMCGDGVPEVAEFFRAKLDFVGLATAGSSCLAALARRNDKGLAERFALDTIVI